jgi:hypothetical protein
MALRGVSGKWGICLRASLTNVLFNDTDTDTDTDTDDDDDADVPIS